MSVEGPRGTRSLHSRRIDVRGTYGRHHVQSIPSQDAKFGVCDCDDMAESSLVVQLQIACVDGFCGRSSLDATYISWTIKL
nr:hypothetical protein CFP56_16508 [Quercus suber]POF04897.1 hypothetical protein CFP56_73858 [Quercus suber]